MDAGGSEEIESPERSARARRLLEAQLSWASAILLVVSTAYVAIELDYRWFAFGLTSLVLYIVPLAVTRDSKQALPWEITLLLSAPLLLHISDQATLLTENVAWWREFASLAFAFSLSTIGFLLTAELQMYSSVRMNRSFSVFFVVMFTLAAAGLWEMASFVSDVLLGTLYLESNERSMVDLLWAAVGGILMGFLYAGYIKSMSGSRQRILGFGKSWEVPDWRTG